MVYPEGCSLCPREECVSWLLFTRVFCVGLIKSDCFVVFMSSFSLLIFCLDSLDIFFFKSQHVALYLFLAALGLRSLVGYSPWGHKESDTTEQLSLPFLPFWVFTAACRLSLVAVHGFLIEVASLVAEYRL